MKIFAFDTALGACSVACLQDGVELGSHFELMARGHAEILMDRIAKVEVASGIGVSDADRFAVTIGPGTFAGVRVGLAAAKAFALATDKRLIGVSTLEAIAAQVVPGTGSAVAVALDARRDQLYFQIFAPDLAPLTEPSAISAEAAARKIDAVLADGKAVHLIGSGATLASDQMQSADGLTVDPTPRQPSALDVGKIATAVSEESTGDPVTPLYLRPPDAKPQKPSGFVQKLRNERN